MTLEHVTSRAGNEITVALAGEADLATSNDLHNALLNAVRKHPGRITVDLAELTFLDSMSIAKLIGARRAAIENGIAFTVARAGGNVLRVLEVSGALDILTAATDDRDEQAS
jgi:anti-sigma B factor antagonist